MDPNTLYSKDDNLNMKKRRHLRNAARTPKNKKTKHFQTKRILYTEKRRK